MQKRIRLIMDVGMTLLPLLMAYSLIGEMFHEIVGTLIFILFITHHVLNRKWSASLFKGKYSAGRIFRTVVNLPFIKENAYQRSGIAYMIAKRVNHLQAQKAAATIWKERRARINTISPGVIVTPLAYDEFAATGDGYQNMIDTSAEERTGT